MKGYCLICEAEIEVQMCCSGRDCGCMGQPIDPPICSDKCYGIWEAKMKKICFINKYFKQEDYLELANDWSELKIAIGNPHIQDTILTQEFKNDFNESGFSEFEIYINWVPQFEPLYGFGMKEKRRDYNDTITFKSKQNGAG